MEMLPVETYRQMPRTSGLSRWLSCELRKWIRTFPHVLRDSADLVSKLKNIAFPATTVVQTADIEHFFMSGTPKEILQDIREFLESEIGIDEPSDSLKQKTDMKNLTCDILETLLFHQYVLNEHLPENPVRVWKTTLGTGMGRKHSGEVADLAFYERCERKLRQYILRDWNFLLWKIQR